MAVKQMGDGSRKVLRDFRYTDPQSGESTNWKAGDSYTGRMDNPWLLDPNGPDGGGPLIESPAPAPTQPIVSLSDPSKEK